MFTNLLLAFSGIFCVMGLLGNTFIVSMNITKWVNTMNELNVINVILSSIGLSNICLSCISFAGTVFFWHLKELFLLYGVYTFYFLLLFLLSSCTLWYVTWLCFYYCMKIVNFNYPSFIWMKVRFPKIVPWLLIGSLLVSLIISIPAACGIHLKANDNPQTNGSNYISANISDNGTQTGFELDYGHQLKFIMIILFDSVAFIMLFLSAVVSVTSLCKHMRQMTQNVNSFRNPMLNAHLGAIKTVTMLLILYISYYLAQSLIFLKGLDVGITMYSICRIVTFAFPALSSLILILGNPSLKKKLTNAFSHAIYCGYEGTWHIS